MVDDRRASIANSYWAGLENNRGEKVPPFADDCVRLENGTQTSGVELAPGAKRTTMPYGQLPGWDNGIHFPSEQAKKDGFKEF